MIGDGLYRAILRLLPGEFRSDYGREIEHTFRDQRREARSEGGIREALVWWMNVRGILAAAAREHAAALLQDLRYGVRGIGRRPGFAAVVIFTLALGIGANTAIFSLVYAVLLRPLPYPQEDRLVHVWNQWTGRARAPLSDPEYLDYAERSRTVDLAAVSTQPVNLSEAGECERVWAAVGTPNVFNVLGVSPVLGRGFELPDVRILKGHVAVLTYGFWQRRFRSDPQVLGYNIRIDGEPFSIIGVAPLGFRMPTDFASEQQADIILPLVLDPAKPRHRRGGHYLEAIGRLRPGVSIRSAGADMRSVVQRLIREYPDQHDQGEFTVLVAPTREELIGPARPVLMILFGAVGLVLLIACANVTNLFLARGETRRPEQSIRIALGAGPYRLFRQVVTESCLLFVAGAAAGLVLAAGAGRVMRAIHPFVLPRVDEAALQVPVIAFALVLGLVAGIVSSVGPALQMSRARAGAYLAAAGRGGIYAGRARMRRVLLMVQVALAMVLLVGAGLLLKSFARLLQVPSGLNAQNVLTLRLSLPEVRYPAKSEVTAYFQHVLDSLRVLPGVREVGAGSGLPLAVASGDWNFDIEGRTVTGRHPAADWFAVCPGYFETLGIRLLDGRLPGRTDVDGAEPIILLNQTAARAFFPRGDAVGQRMRLGGQVPQPWRRIVGVVGDVRYRGLDQAPIPEMYLPHAQFLHFSPGVQARSMTVVVRTALEPQILAQSVRDEIRGIDPEVPAAQLRTMSDVVVASIADRTLNLALFAAFAVLALAVAVVGVYGLSAYHAAERTGETGLRMALGAAPSVVRSEMLRSGMKLVGWGILAGGIGAFLVSRALRPLLFEVSPKDLIVFAAVTLLLGLAGLAACYIPAFRASRLDPCDALRGR